MHGSSLMNTGAPGFHLESFGKCFQTCNRPGTMLFKKIVIANLICIFQVPSRQVPPPVPNLVMMIMMWLLTMPLSPRLSNGTLKPDEIVKFFDGTKNRLRKRPKIHL